MFSTLFHEDKYPMRTVVLITSRYPYLPGETYLETELPYLAEHFDSVVIVPCAITDKVRDVPVNVKVETGLAKSLTTGKREKICRLLRHPLMTADALLRSFYKPLSIKKALGNTAGVIAVANWFSSYLAKQDRESNSFLIYSYWTRICILGARLGSHGHKNVVGIVARSHRYDLYIKEIGDPNWPFHKSILRALDRLLVISEHGRDYLISHHPWMKSKVEVHRLALDDTGINTSAPRENVFTVCSCSNLIAFKRVDLIVQALGHVGREFPKMLFRWHHFGDGPLREEIEKLAKSCLPSNINAQFHGIISNAQIREFYREEFIDAFINTSSSEGVPVSVMEAQCAGIPVIATSVCGTPELVNSGNGARLDPDASVTDIAAALGRAIRDPSWRSEKRKASRQSWENMSQASKIYSEFIRRLAQYFPA
jgi:colanic acid/amylovoran biosynthesis glycosyltransferase